MATVTVDPERDYCVVSFPAQRGYLPYLKGEVIVANDGRALKDDEVVAAGDKIDYILQRHKECGGLFDVVLSANKRRKSEQDPIWFAAEVSVHEKQESFDAASIKSVIERSRTLLGSALELLPK